MELAPIYVPGRPTLVGLEWSHADMYVPGGPTLVGLEWSYSDMYVAPLCRGLNGATQLAMYVPGRLALASLNWGHADTCPAGPPWWALQGAIGRYLCILRACLGRP